ncbi:MAG: 23S rRNA (guanosine(2251)-2'-O)-methyltransferase RlmB [Alphaproteobacteria bacterium]|nr:23S rRNA (guanosine(2251)-2'-O)-methyltransferase RlmB [Alphaproteobacteria bacterium]
MKQRSHLPKKSHGKPPQKAAGKAFHKKEERGHGKADKHAKPSSSRLNIHLFGQHAVREAWLNPRRHIQNLYITENALKGFEDVLHQAASLKRPPPTIIEKDTLDKSLPPGTVHQGIALNCATLPEIGLQDLLIRASNKERALFVILDQVTDPHNMGAILRSASAFGADGMIVQKRHAPELQGPAGAIIGKTACGALEHLPIAYETNLSRSIEMLQEAGYFVYGLDERGQDMPVPTDIPAKAVLVLGAEGDGLRHLVKEKCDVLVKLPTAGAIQSLNVSNAAAVALYVFSPHGK